MNENEINEEKLDDCTQAFKECEKQNKKKSFLARICDKNNYNDKSVYYFNKSILIGSVVLICFCLVLFFK